MKKIFIIISIFIPFVVFAQGTKLIVTPSMDGCIYNNKIEKKIIIIDKIYSDLELEKDKIIFNEENVSKYDDVFDYDSTKKFMYYYAETITADSTGMFSISEKIAIHKTEPSLDKNWSIIEFEIVNNSRSFSFKFCKENFTNLLYNKLINLKENKILLLYENKNSNMAFNLLSLDNCESLHYFEFFENENVKVTNYNEDFVFMHSGSSLCILKI